MRKEMGARLWETLEAIARLRTFGVCKIYSHTFKILDIIKCFIVEIIETHR